MVAKNSLDWLTK